MFSPNNLTGQILERVDRLDKTDFESYDAELRYFLTFLYKNSSTCSLLTIIDANTSVNFEQWNTARSDSGRFELPDTEEGRATIYYNIIRHCVSRDNEWNALSWAREFSGHSAFNVSLQKFTRKIIQPFANFVCDQINERSNVLYLIERFKQQVEWFRQEELYSLYEADTSVGEASLDLKLRASLFDGGIDYPFSQPSSPSGNADIVALVGSADPLVLEVKVFDPDRSKGKRNIQQGFHQILRYANDYSEGFGYLVIFNCSPGHLAISSGDAIKGAYPVRVAHAGKTFFIIAISVNPDAVSASKENPASRTVINFTDLIGQ